LLTTIGGYDVKSIKKIILALITLGFFTTTWAQVPVPRGWYADGSVGITNTNTSSDDDDDKGSSTALGYNINVGYKFIPFFGVEAGYTSYGTSSSSFTGNHAIDLVAKAIIPFPEVGAEIYAKLGGAQVYPQGDDNGTGLFYGFGADYWILPHMSILIQWTQAKTNGAGPLNLFSAGVGFLI
jgi:hypothetical protein